MKNVIIFGASGSLAHVVIAALKDLRDVRLTLFVRKKSRLHGRDADGTTVIEGDAMDAAAVERAVHGQDIVYVNLAGELEPMVRNIVQAMRKAGAKRIIAISSIGIYATPLKSVLKPYRALADVVEASGLDYTILRPEWFTDADEVNYTLSRKGEPEAGSAVSRKSIAAFVASLVKDPAQHVKDNVGISKP